MRPLLQRSARFISCGPGSSLRMPLRACTAINWTLPFPRPYKSSLLIQRLSSHATNSKSGNASTDVKTCQNGTPCHLDIPAHDLPRITKFYSDVFGWKCTPSVTGANYMLFTADCVRGGFFKTTDPIGLGKSVSPVLYASDIPLFVPKIVAAGGVITRCNTLIDKSVGAWLGFADTEGNPMSLFTTRLDDLVQVSTIDQKVLVAMTPHDVYEMFLDADKHTQTACADAKTKCVIDRRPNGAVSVYDSFITGNIICYKRDRQITQAWTAKDWPKNHYSNVSLSFEPDDNSTGCWITLKQTGVPNPQLVGWAEGWYNFYWNKMKLVKTVSANPPVKATASANGAADAAAAAAKN